MDSFFTILEERARKIDSLLCVGLDPYGEDLPEQSAAAVKRFCLGLIETTHDLVLAYKLKPSYFLVYGVEGYQVLKDVIQAIPEGVPVILDDKRGDIAGTTEAHAAAAFKALGVSAVTASPYMGYDSIHPFLKNPAHGVFLVCKSSNPGALDLQELSVLSEGQPMMVYEKVAALAREWNEKNNLGLLVSAIYPDALKRVRRLTPDLWLMVPGTGMKGGDLTEALHAGLRTDGLGMLVTVAHAVTRAENPRQAATQIKEEISRVRCSFLDRVPMPSEPGFEISDALAEGLLHAGCVRFGSFKLRSSGIVSPIYIDLRPLVSHPELLAEVGRAYLPILKKLVFDRIAALPYAALPIATAISLQSGWPLLYPRKEPNSIAGHSDIEGVYSEGERVVIIDALASTGASKFETIDKLALAGLQVKDVVVLIDRQAGAAERLAEAGYRLHAVATLSGLLDYWERTGRIPEDKIRSVREFVLAQ